MYTLHVKEGCFTTLFTVSSEAGERTQMQLCSFIQGQEFQHTKQMVYSIVYVQTVYIRFRYLRARCPLLVQSVRFTVLMFISMWIILDIVVLYSFLFFILEFWVDGLILWGFLKRVLEIFFKCLMFIKASKTT